jgi:hypothetical protein
MTDDGLIYSDGRVMSLREARLREQIERDLSAVENDLLTTAALLDAAQEREDVRRHEVRMAQLHNHLAGLRAERKTADKRGLVYKITYNARLDARRR